MISWSEGTALTPVDKTVTQEQITAYARASGDHNPIHLDPEFASTTQFGGIVAHGMLTLAFVSEMLTRDFGRSWLETGRLKVRFKAAARPGDRVTTWGEVVKQGRQDGSYSLECSVGLRNQRGEDLIAGTAHLSLAG